MKQELIDIVIPWVDGNDVNWINEKNKYLNIKGDSNINRFRNFDNLQYLFRGIEENMPWINKIFFVTWGHIPSWMNIHNEKIVIVKHSDFIPSEYLPTFNSNVIEMNLHRIKGLSSKFILFNDDLFILKKLHKRDFFYKGLPKDFYIEYKKSNPSKRHITITNNYMRIVNKYFNKKKFILNNFNKAFNIRYGTDNLKTLNMLKEKNFQDIYSQHLSQPFTKEIFYELWDKEQSKINAACFNKFRADTDIGVQLCRYWQLLTGKFIPSRKIGKYFIIKENNDILISAIEKRKYKMICINDANPDINFERSKLEINTALEKNYRKKCSFEK